MTLKIYTKGERVLRCEIMLHNARKLKFGVSLENWPKVVEHLQGLLERFIEVVQCADEATIDDGTYDALPRASQVGKSRVAGLHLTSERLATVLDSVLALAAKPGGFTSGELAEQVRHRLEDPAAEYRSRQAAYDLKKLRGKNLVAKVLKPVLRNRNLQGPPPRNNNAIDHHYYNLRQEMRRLFRTLNIAA